MATQTANLGLKKPEGSDYVQVSDFNGNSDLLDAIIGKLGELRTEEKSSLVAAINEAMISGGLDAPYVDSATGHWFTWDNTLLKFIDTGVVAAGGRWYTGTTITGTSSTPTSFDTGITLAQPGDLYLNTTTSYVYLCVTAGNQSAAKWTYLCSIKGNTGEQGLRGLTGAVFTPSVNAATGIISWTNDGGLVNPPSVNIKGQKGDTGNGLNIKGIYASLAALQEAVPSPLAGDMYNIGESAPYRVYMYDANLGWTDIGQIQGPTGPAGKSAYVAAVEAGYTGNEDTFNSALSVVPTHIENSDIHVTAEDKATWSESDIFIATYGTTTSAEIEAAYQAVKTVVCVYKDSVYYLSKRMSETRHIFSTIFPTSISTSVSSYLRKIACIRDVWESSGNLGFKPDNHSSTHASGGLDPITPASIGAAAEPVTATALPDSGTALTDNTIYNVGSAVSTYQFAPPASGWAHGKFTTDATVAITFSSGSFVGSAPEFGASKTYEFDVLNGVWAFVEVVSA